MQHMLTAVATPRANGQVERYNRTILDALTSSLPKEETSWDREVNKVKWGLKNTLNKATGKSPSELLLGYKPRQKAEAKLLNEIGGPKVREDRAKMRKRAAEKIVENQV